MPRNFTKYWQYYENIKKSTVTRGVTHPKIYIVNISNVLCFPTIVYSTLYRRVEAAFTGTCTVRQRNVCSRRFDNFNYAHTCMDDGKSVRSQLLHIDEATNQRVVSPSCDHASTNGIDRLNSIHYHQVRNKGGP